MTAFERWLIADGLCVGLVVSGTLVLALRRWEVSGRWTRVPRWLSAGGLLFAACVVFYAYG